MAIADDIADYPAAYRLHTVIGIHSRFNPAARSGRKIIADYTIFKHQPAAAQKNPPAIILRRLIAADFAVSDILCAGYVTTNAAG